jgi:hypothetical protein
MWYLLMLVIVLAGVGLIVYSRYEVQHPASAAIGPSASDNWQAALAVDICGKIEPNLPASSNLSSVGLRTFGNGLVNASPSVSSTPSAFEGAKATLGLFAKNYRGFVLKSDEISYPAKKPSTYVNGDTCKGPLHGRGSLVAKVWSSTTSTHPSTVSDPTSVHISNGEMITVAFVPSGASIPEPPSKTALVAALGR